MVGRGEHSENGGDEDQELQSCSSTDAPGLCYPGHILVHPGALLSGDD